MACQLNQFIRDCRTILWRNIPGPKGREEVRTRLERLLQKRRLCPRALRGSATGLHVLYEDPELGFQVLAHMDRTKRACNAARSRQPWAIYSQPTHYTDMTEWEREDDGGDPDHAKLKPAKKYRLTPGHAGGIKTAKSIRWIIRTIPALCASPEPISIKFTCAIRFENRRSQTHVAAAGDVTARVNPATLRGMHGGDGELALVDMREELIFSQRHLLLARSVPFSRFELKFAQLVPRRTTPVVLCDDRDGRAERAAAILSRNGYADVSILAGGVDAWAAAGFELFSGVNVPSKAFGEYVEHAKRTPSIAAEELEKLLRDGADLVVLDSRPFDEYVRVSIPTATNVPGAELVLRAREIAPSPRTTVVVNCAGRTRSIIGAQSLINAGLPNKVVALRNGTMGWSLAGFAAIMAKTGARRLCRR